MIKILCVGKIKEDYIKQAIDEYIKRLSKYTMVQVIEVAEFNTNDIKKNLLQEKQCLLKYINSKDYIITLEINGKEYTSLLFAKKINDILIKNSNITFIIGSSYGLDEDIKSISNERISFSKLTFPHQLFRVMLLEQIYRAYKINNNESYHK